MTLAQDPTSAGTSDDRGDPEQAAPLATMPSAPARTHTATMWVSILLALIIAVAFVTFVLQNTRSTVVSFLGWHGSLPVSLAVLIAAFVGVLLAAITATIRLTRRRHRARAARK